MIPQENFVNSLITRWDENVASMCEEKTTESDLDDCDDFKAALEVGFLMANLG